MGVYFAFKYKGEVEDKISEGIQKELNDVFLGHGDKSDQAAKVIQGIQKTFKCCGVKGSGDYGTHPILSSCCGEDYGDTPQKACSAGATPYSIGCGEKVKETLKKYLGGTAGVAIALVLVQLIIVFMACCLSREVRN